jgi:hypothetical protein
MSELSREELQALMQKADELIEQAQQLQQQLRSAMSKRAQADLPVDAPPSRDRRRKTRT